MTASKYRNVRTSTRGFTFASRKEAKRYEELELLVKAGEISVLRRQPRFRLAVNGLDICTYVADFDYWDSKLCKRIIEDVKGMRTPLYRVKKSLMMAVHGIDIKEV